VYQHSIRCCVGVAMPSSNAVYSCRVLQVRPEYVAARVFLLPACIHPDFQWVLCAGVGVLSC